MGGPRRSWAGRVGAVVALAALGFGAQAQERPDGVRSDIVVQALSLLGTPYRFGGSSPDVGFDCSGLVRHVFASVLERDLPRRSEEISGVGHAVTRAELQPGDLVFFDTLRRAFSHVAIYIGEGRFVHAPARNGRVRIEALDDRYWATRFNGARRLMEPRPARAMSTKPGEISTVDTSSLTSGFATLPERLPGP
ncbi:MAG TPA: C40 family peptidase [Burkholderiaceae bacterium]|nr:C40 family peptidase [Burkholderiaceae bacterium]